MVLVVKYFPFLIKFIFQIAKRNKDHILRNEVALMYRKSVWKRHQNDVLFPKYRLCIQNKDVHKTTTKGLIEQKKSWIGQKVPIKLSNYPIFISIDT